MVDDIPAVKLRGRGLKERDAKSIREGVTEFEKNESRKSKVESRKASLRHTEYK